MTTPISHLPALLRSMHPHLHDGVYAFVTVPKNADLGGLEPIAAFREEEGLTLIVEEGVALRAGLKPLFRAAWITLRVHSDLQAVGLTAAVATALAEAGISCNVVAAAFHDHLFVPVESADAALAALHRVQARARSAATESAA